MKTGESTAGGERVVCYRTRAGYRLSVIPKPGFAKIYAMFGTRYGSMDTVCHTAGRPSFSVPDGTAHFMEHKLFEGETEDAFTRYAKTGANANAYTTFDKTVYLFSCTERFEESFAILLDFVTHPYFTEQTVAKEQGIIGQEIKMYEDDPQWRVVLNLLQALFVNNPVRIDTAGTVETIATITPEILYGCYEAFYNPENMEIVVCGDVDPDRVFAQCDAALPEKKAGKPERSMPDEPDGVAKARVEQRLSVAMPQFLIGFKEPFPKEGIDAVRQEVESDLILELLFGSSSPFYRELYEAGLINADFSAGYDQGYRYGLSLIGGESRDPDAVVRRVAETLKTARENGLDAEAFSRVRRKNYGDVMRSFNQVENVAQRVLDLHMLGATLPDLLQTLKTVSLEDCENRLREHFTEAHMALSIVIPENKEEKQ